MNIVTYILALLIIFIGAFVRSRIEKASGESICSTCWMLGVITGAIAIFIMAIPRLL